MRLPLPFVRGLVAAWITPSLATAAAPGPKPLGEVAGTIAAAMPAGCIVTAEKRGSSVTFAIAGKSDLTDTPPERIVFEIGSISKVFTGLLLAQAVLEGQFHPDTTLREAMGPGASFADPRVGSITLAQLATHTSGLPRLPGNLVAFSDPGDPYAIYDRAALDRFLGETRLEHDPPFEQSYSNLGAGLLGDLLARRYGRSWEALVAEKITGPLGMKDTGVVPNADQERRHAPPFDGTNRAHPWRFQSLAGCGALHSTAADLLIFGNALLHPEKSPLEKALRLLMEPRTPEKDIGLALMISETPDGRVYWHNGGTGGYRSLFQVTPKSDRIEIVLINNAQTQPESVLAAATARKPRTHESGKVLPLEQLALYEGVYSLGKDSRFTILRRGEQLWAQLTGQSFLRLFPHETDDRFFLKEVAAEFQFHRENGSISALTLLQNGRQVRAKKTAQTPPAIRFSTARELAPYAGTYELLPGQVFTLEVRHDTLFARLAAQPFAPVFEKPNGRFEYDVVEAALEFERDASGAVTALKLHQNGQVLRAPRKK